MIVRHLNEIIGTKRDVVCPDGAFKSLRMLLASDGLGFSVHVTEVRQGGPYYWHYKNHLESCYCIKGTGELTNQRTGDVFQIYPETIYALEDNEPHTLLARTDMQLLSVFNPPVIGTEVHREDGSYAI